MTEAEYLAYDASHDGKHEFVNGEMWAMAGAHPIHNLIASNMTVALGRRLDGSACYPLTSDQRVYVDETGLYVYPDVTVACGRLELAPTDPPSLLNPALIVEVLSKSTATFDKNQKFAHYRLRPSVQAVVFVSWPDRRVEHYRRQPSGEWLLTEARDHAVISLPTLGIEIPLDEIYRHMDDVLAAQAPQ